MGVVFLTMGFLILASILGWIIENW